MRRLCSGVDLRGLSVYAAMLVQGCGASTIYATSTVGPTEVDDPVAWYRMDDPAAIGHDSSGHGRDALPVYVSVIPDAVRGQVASFDGTVGSPALVFVPAFQSDFTVSLWLKTSQLGPDETAWADGPRIINADLSGVHLDFALSLGLDKLAEGTGTPGNATEDDTALKSQRTVVDGTWHHVALTRDGTQGIWGMFVDGLPDSTRNGVAGPLTLPETISFGDLGDTDPSTPALEAELSDARWYDRVLSAAGIGFLATQ